MTFNSSDRTVRIWDTRAKGRAMLTVEAASCDVNVISWSRLVSFLMASGNDDGSFRVWDLRSFKRCDGTRLLFIKRGREWP